MMIAAFPRSPLKKVLRLNLLMFFSTFEKILVIYKLLFSLIFSAQQYSNPSSNSTQTNSNGNANTTNDSMEQEPASNSNEVKDERMEDVPI